MSSTPTKTQDYSDLQNPHVLSLFNNVPETNLSTFTDNDEHDDDDDRINPALAENAALGLKWSEGIAKLPGSDLQFRMNENGDVEVLSNISDDESHNNEKASKTENSHNASPTNSVSLSKKPSLPVENTTETSDSTDNGKVFSKQCFPSKTNEVSKTSPTKIADLKMHKEKTKKTCEYCGKSNYRKYFLGRFCSRVCIAKHAVATRKKRPSKKDFQIQDLNKSVSSHQQNGFSSCNELKLKIRLPPSNKFRSKPHLLKHQPYNRFSHFRKRKLSVVMDEVLSDFRTFNWNNYLSDTNSRGLGPDEFQLITGRNPYPLKENPFKVGNYLEAVDPVHLSLISLVSVAQVEGFRMRLHFEGYLEPFDFWVSADCPLIFPCGFCEDTGRTLSAPSDWDKSKISDIAHAFSDRIFSNNTKFKVGDKLEAVDRKHQDLLCVATVAEIIGDYILVHFDGWDKEYDYWANSSSPFIHPVGWSETNQQLLSPPPCFDPNACFSWNEYLKDTKSVAAESSCFLSRSRICEKNTKFEVVDKYNPFLVRVATIVDVTDLRVKVYFDGWDVNFDHWIDIDSLDIYPVGWCLKASFPLHPPVNCEMIYPKPCPTLGCSGLGHSNLLGNLVYHKKHYTENGCPYSQKNIGKHAQLDRFSPNFAKDVYENNQKNERLNQSKLSSKLMEKRRRPFRSKDLSFDVKVTKRPKVEKNAPFLPFNFNSGKVLKKSNHSERFFQPSVRKISSTASKHQKNVPSQPLESDQNKSLRKSTSLERIHQPRSRRGANENNPSLKEKVVRSSVLKSLTAATALHLPHCWDKNVRYLPGVDGLDSSHVSMWGLKEVTNFIKTLTGKVEYADLFEREEIDGEALLLLTQNDIIKTLKIKLGPALKIYNAVLLFKVLDDGDVQ